MFAHQHRRSNIEEEIAGRVDESCQNLLDKRPVPLTGLENGEAGLAG